ncbi:MAG: cytochrome c, partial [Acidobacteria bacterium]|nr:cytochrome c [Acidobacteriota bacterium]
MRALVVAAAILVFSGTVAGAAEDGPTYNGNVGRILLDNCASCHRPGQVAPMSLLNYAESRPWARAIKAKVESREMPPWFADPRFGKFSNDSSLSDAEIEAVV